MILRDATPDDARFIRASWFESYRKGGFAPPVAYPIYQAGQEALISRLLASSSTKIACLPELPDEICGWACWWEEFQAPSVVHYAYVKKPYRRRGIAKALLSSIPQVSECTHMTRRGASLAAKMPAKYNPYLLYTRIT